MSEWRTDLENVRRTGQFLMAYFYEKRGEWIYDFANWRRGHVCGINEGTGPWTHWMDLEPPRATDV